MERARKREGGAGVRATGQVRMGEEEARQKQSTKTREGEWPMARRSNSLVNRESQSLLMQLRQHPPRTQTCLRPPPSA